MKLRLLSLASWLVLPFAAKADVILASHAHDFTVSPGGSFHVSFSLHITGDEEVAGLDYFLRADQAGVFTLLSRDLAGSPITDPYPFSSHVLNPSSTNLGGLTDIDTSLTFGSYGLGTYVFTVDASAALGEYSFSTLNASWLSSEFEDYAFASTPALSISVASVPEAAASGALVGLSLLSLGWLNRRRGLAPRE